MSDWEIIEDGNDWDIEGESSGGQPHFLERTDRQGEGFKDIGEGIYDMWANLPESFQGLGQTIGSGAAQAQVNPQRFAQNVGGAFGELGTHFGNLPGASDKYLATRGEDNWETRLVRQFLQAITPKNESTSWSADDNMLQKIMKSTHLPKPGQFNYAEGLGREPASFEKEREADELMKQYGPTLLAGPGGAGSIAAQVFGSAENPFGIMTAPTVVKGATKTLKAIPEIAKKGFDTGKNVVNKTIVEPIKDVSKKHNLERSILEAKKEKFNAEQQKTFAQAAIDKIMQEHLSEKDGTARFNAAHDLKEAGEQLHTEGSKLYDEFNSSKWGQKRVFDPISPEFFDKQYRFPKGALSDVTQKMINDTFGTYSETSTRNPLTGQPEFKVNKQSKQPTVEQYINLQKQLRDEAAHIRKNASAQDVAKGKADILNAQAASLDRLREDVNKKIEGTLPSKQQRFYQGIQNFWKNYVRPFEDSSTLSKTSGNHPAVSTSTILESLDKEGYNHLKDILLENEKVSQSVGKHDWRSVDTKNPASLKAALEGDLGKTLDPKLNVELKKHFDTLVDSEKTIQALKTKLKEKGLSKAEITNKLATYKKLSSMASKTGGILYALKVLTGIGI